MWQGGGHLMPGDQCKQTLGEIKKTSEGVAGPAKWGKRVCCLSLLYHSYIKMILVFIFIGNFKIISE